MTGTDTIAALMREQFWCWMHDADASHPILRHYGFAFRLDFAYRLADPMQITLNEFSIALDRPNGRLMVPRDALEPVLFISSVAFPSIEATGTSALVGATLLRDLFAWIGSYERWVNDSFGYEHRGQLLGIDVTSVKRRPGQWWSLALGISGLLSSVGAMDLPQILERTSEVRRLHL
jgi:hypothetical protein